MLYVRVERVVRCLARVDWGFEIVREDSFGV